MKIKLLDAISDKLVNCKIKKVDAKTLPSINDGWVFNLDKEAKKNKIEAYVIQIEGESEEIEGCVLFSIHEKFGPFMNFLEIAPRNKRNNRKYDFVAGCLIAYTCWLSIKRGVGENNGIVTFQASGKSEDETSKLENLYRNKYGAIKNLFGLMEIDQEEGKKLMTEYLNRMD